MSFPRYPRYKESGVEWLGRVPEHWEMLRLGSLFREVAEPGHDGLPILSVSIHDGVSDKEMSEEDMERKVSRSDDLSKYVRVQPKDLVYNMMRAWQGGFGTVCVEGMVSPAYVVARPRKPIETAYVEHLLRTPSAIEQLRRHSHGVTDFRLRLYWDEFKNIRVPLPPPSEQKAVVEYVARESATIEGLVAEQQRLMELLKEKRQAVISHAVTKGLNPHAPMKNSGIEWLGEVPAHWKVGKCGFYVSILSGFAFPSAEFTESAADTKLLRGINVGVGQLRWDDTVYWQRIAEDGLGEYEMRIGDLVIGMDRPLIGEGMRVAKVQATDLPCLLLQRVARLEPNSKLETDYLFSLLSSEMFVAHFSPDTTGVSVPHISPEQISNFVVPIPPVEEQREIAQVIAVEALKSDTLIKDSRKAIDLLQERRTALISAAVTGQIDVRQLAEKQAAA